MGWRKEEPGDQLPEESPLRILLLVRQALAENLVSKATANELLGKEPRKRVRASEKRLRAAADSLATKYESDRDLVHFSVADDPEFDSDKAQRGWRSIRGRDTARPIH